MVGDLLIVGNARKRARQRESILTWALVKHHPWFADARISQNCRWVLDSGGSFPLTVEGGDILTLSDSLALIGASERTSWAMIVALGQELIAEGFGHVLVVEMPKQRSSMHLDTVFTMVDWDKAVLYGPILEAGGREEVQVIRMHGEGKQVQIEEVKGDLIAALAEEEHPISAIRCGAGDPIHERREQWTDGSNYVAISPGVVLGYARNRHTSQAMEEAGFRVVSADAFLADLDQDFGGDFSALVESERRYAVQIIGSELSRGRGGPRCLTLPLLRD
jgi:arginine deiminase